MAKITLTDVTAGYDTATISAANNTLIENAIENTLSRDGTSPNQMEANLDMNSYRVQNLPTAVSNSEPLTLGQAASLASISTAFTKENVGAVLYAETAAETSAGVTPTNYYYPPGNVLRYGTNTTPGTTDMTTAIDNAIASAPIGGTVVVPDGTYLVTGCTISGKTDLRITGKGKITNDTDADTFDLVGTISGLEIDGLHLVGANDGTFTQQGIGNLSGQTISDVSFHDLKIEQTNVGISLNANLSGSYDNVSVYANKIKTIVGTGSGQGYGIHMAKATNVSCFGNFIENASRHSIYHAAGINTGNIIANNIIRDHRLTDNDGNIRPALYVGRSSGVTVIGNSIIEGYDGGILIAHVNSTSDVLNDVIVANNSVINRQNVTASMYVGEQAVPTNSETLGVQITGNSFYSDATTTSGGTELVILNGRNISVRNNIFRWTNVAAASQGIQVGHDSYISDADDCDYIWIEDNTFIANASGARAIAVISELCTSYTSNEILFKNNRFSNIATKVYYPSTSTNTGLQDFSDLLARACEVVTTTNVITAVENGKTFYLNAAGGFTSTLPAPAIGLKFTFIVTTAPTTAYIITTTSGANVLYGTLLDIVGEQVAITAQDTITFVANTSLIGDSLEVESDGTNWYVTAKSLADGGITVSVT